MTSILETQVTALLTQELGRAPTAAEIANGLVAPQTLSQIHNTLNAAQSVYTIGPTSSIQTALDNLNSNGGGTLNLLPGTWTVTTTLTGYSSVAIVGVSPSATIIDFNSTSAHLAYAGTNVYTTGTITVASGVNITGSGTAWLANVTAGQSLFLGTRWYVIAAITSDTTLILAEAYGDTVTLPSNYRIATPVQNVMLSNLTLKNSTGTALTFTDARSVTINDVNLITNNKGASFTNVSQFASARMTAAASTSNGFEITNMGLSSAQTMVGSGNGGHNFILNNVKTVSFSPFSATAATNDGMNITTGVDLILVPEASGNGGNGIQLVATCDNIVIQDGPVRSNTADGIKLTATSDNCRITDCDITANGAYGINIAASSCDTNLILGNVLAANTTAAANNSGTGTLIRSNIGLTDN